MVPPKFAALLRTHKPDNAGQTEKLTIGSAFQLKSDLLLPRLAACTNRSLSESAKEKYSSFSSQMTYTINAIIISTLCAFVKNNCLEKAGLYTQTGNPSWSALSNRYDH